MKQAIIMHTILMLSAFVINAYGWSDGNNSTHEKITDKTVDNSILEICMVNSLSLNQGVDTFIDGKKTIEWLRYGSKVEDSPMCRASNHFHDPLQYWDQSGLTTLGVVTEICNTGMKGGDEYPPSKIKSAIFFATGFLSPSGDKSETNNQWDWDNARNYYHVYLTGEDFSGEKIAFSSQQREQYLGKSIRALGQVMHLLQDMSVPAHTRNDFQVVPFKGHTAFHGDVDAPGTFWGFGEELEVFVASNSDSNQSWFEATKELQFDDFSLTDFWDQNLYNGRNPDDTWQYMTGLAEFANPNFITEASVNDYPYPDLSSVPWEDIRPALAADGITDFRIYWVHSGLGHRIASPGYFTIDFETYAIPQINLKKQSLIVDNNVKADYAEILIPEAIAYSAGLIDYFFRGEINMVSDAETGYGYVIENNSEEIMDGLFSLHYFSDNNDVGGPVPDASGYPWSQRLVIGAKDPDNPHNNQSDNIGSILPPFYLPYTTSEQMPNKYILVFRGKLGKEDDAVVGKVLDFKPYLDISLPEEGYYAMTDKHPYYQNTSDPKYLNQPTTKGFDKILVNVKNISPGGRQITGGIVRLDVVYCLGQGDQLKYPAENTSLNFFTVSQIEIIDSIPTDSPVGLEFDLAGNEIPLWATDVYLYLTYKGAFGDETEATLLGFKDISEPTPIDFFNLTDVICVDNMSGPELYDAGSSEVLSIVDENNDGEADEWDIYPHNIEDLRYDFSDADCPSCIYTAPAIIPPGDYFRLFVLTNYDDNVYGGSFFKVEADVADTHDHMNLQQFEWDDHRGVKNQWEFGKFSECPESNPSCWSRKTRIYKKVRGVPTTKRIYFINDGYPGNADPLTETLCSYEDE